MRLRAVVLVIVVVGLGAEGQEELSATTAVHAAHPPQRASPSLWGDLRPGPHSVGYRTTRMFDPTRTFGARIGASGTSELRLVTVHVWYPASASSAKSMPLQDYVALSETDGRITPAVRQRRELDLDGLWSDLCVCRSPRTEADARLTTLLATPVAAIPSATPAAGRHPVVVYSLGDDMHSLENVVLWEYLGSHGYVVVVTPSVGHKEVPMEPIGPTAVEVRARDMEFALGWVRDMPFADVDRVAAAGFSLGGWAALALAMRNADVDALVALDASFNLPRRAATVRSMAFYDPTSLHIPVLNLRQDEPEIDLSILDALVHADRYDTMIGDMERSNASHHAFTSVYAFSVEGFPSSGDPEQLATLTYNRDVFELVASRVRMFLDAHLKSDPAARAGLQQAPGWDGVPEAMVGHRHLPPAVEP